MKNINKNKKFSIFALISSVVLMTTIFFEGGLNNQFLSGVNANSCPNNIHVGNHYLAKTPTFESDGNQEFYVCCKCHEVMLANEPHVGSWTEAANPDFGDDFEKQSNRAYLCKLEQYIPTTDELKAGVTFDGTSTHCAFTASEYVKVDDIADANAKTAMAADPNFGTYVNHVSGVNSHQLKSIISTNTIVGYTIEITFSYYVVDENFHVLMMSQGGVNPDLKTCSGSTRGAIKTATVSYTLTNAVDNVFNIYGMPSGLVNDIYVGNISAKLYKMPTAADFLAAGSDGYLFDMHSANEKFESESATKVSDLENGDVKTALTGSKYVVDGHVIHVKRDGNNNWKFNGINSSNVPARTYVKIEMIYYCVTDSSYKLVSGAGLGTTETLEGNFKKWTYAQDNIAKGIDYISFYEGNFDVYVCSIRITLSEPKVTKKGYKVGDVIDLYEGVTVYWNNKNGYQVTAFDHGIEVNESTMPGLGTSPRKVELLGGQISNYTEICTVNKLEAGVKYRLTLSLYNVSGYDGNLYLFDNAGTFLLLKNYTGVGYHEAYVDYQFSSISGWMLFYTNTPEKSGTLYVGGLTAEVLEINQ